VKRERVLLLVWFVACFAFSAITDVRWLLGLLLAVGLLFWRQAGRAARRTLFSAVPVTLMIIGASWAWTGLVLRQRPDGYAYAALGLRTTLIAFTSFSVLARVDLLAALAPWPTLLRLLVITLGQIHALRLLVTESWLGLRSRLPRRPRALDTLRGAGGISATLFILAHRNARDITDAMRSRGF
jgi:cobalt/nickel transport system permease protein